MRNVLIISSSPRLAGNSATLSHEFERGAKEAGNHVDFIDLATKKINYCHGCYGCADGGHCVQKDDFNDILDLVMKANVIVLATPVYFYSMSGQLKVFIDRLVANYTKIRADIYLIVTAWDDDKKHLESTVTAIRGCTRDCLVDCPEKGVILGSGLWKDEDAKGHPELLKVAYEMGLKA